MLGVAKAAQGDRAGAGRPEQVLAKGCGLSGCGPQSRFTSRSRRGKTDQARQRLNRVLQSDPSNVDAMIDLSATEEKPATPRKRCAGWKKPGTSPAAAQYAARSD